MANLSLPQLVIKRQTLLENRRAKWENVWQDIADHIIPVYENIKQDKQSGERMGSEIYDGSGTQALKIMSNGLFGNTASQAIKWFRLRLPEEELNERKEIAQWLTDVEEHLYGVFLRSNFYNEVFSMIQCGIGIGTSVLGVQENRDKTGVVFNHFHPGQVYLGVSSQYDIDLIHRKMPMQARQLTQQFGLDNVPMTVRNAFENDPFKEFDIIHSVAPNDDYDPNSKLAKKKKIVSIWQVKDATDNEAVMRVSGFDRFPYPTWLYERIGHEEYGRGPGMYALADCMGLNLMSKTLLGLAEKSVDPAWMIPSSMEGELDHMPRGENYFSDPEQVPFPLQVGANYPIGVDREERKIQAIREHFHVEAFLMLQSSERALTATEVLERQGEKVSLLGSAIGRLSGTYDQIIDRVFDIESAAGRLPQAPDSLLEAMDSGETGGRIDTQYLGPLAQAQRRLFQSMGISRSLEALIPVFQLKPETVDNFDWDEISTEIAESHGMPPKGVRDKKVVEQERLQRAQQEAQARQIAQFEAQSKGVKQMAEADKASDGQLAAAGEELFG